MALIPLVCPHCTAPVDGPGVCRFCGVTLVTDTPAASRSEEHFFVALRVGPSNHERVVSVLEERAGLDGEAARILLTRSPCELAFGTDRGRASEMEAKRLVASVPSLVAAAMDERDAQALVAALEKAGARAHWE